MKQSRFKMVAISDIHLGSHRSEVERLHKFLTAIDTNTLYIIGDLIDFGAICFNRKLSHDQLCGIVSQAINRNEHTLFDLDYLAEQKILEPSHLQILCDLQDLAAHGTKVIYIPGNHDALFRRYHGQENNHFSIQKEDIYRTPKGEHYLVTHGDAYDGFIHQHLHPDSWLQRGFVSLEEKYSHVIRCFRTAAARLLPAIEIPPSAFSLAEAIEVSIKTAIHHEERFQNGIIRELFRRNAKILAANATNNRQTPYLDGAFTGHSHVDGKTRAISPLDNDGNSIGPCHVTNINAGSWVWGRLHRGGTAIVIGKNDSIRFVRQRKHKGIIKHKSPPLPFAPQPSLPCPHCGKATIIVAARP